MFNTLQRFSVIIGALLCVLIWAFSYFVVHAPEGWPRLVWVLVGVAVFVLCAFFWKRPKV